MLPLTDQIICSSVPLLFLASKKENLRCDTKNPTYIGCFSDDGHRDLPYRVLAGGGHNQTSCNEACKDYEYFALQFNGQCRCGNQYGTKANYIQKLDDECGGPRGLGKGWRNAVYETCTNSGNFRSYL